MGIVLRTVLCLLFIVTVVQSATVHLNTVDVASLQDVPLCPLGKVCHFDAKIEVSMKELQGKKDDVNLQLSFDFDVQHLHQSANHSLLQLEVTKVQNKAIGDLEVSARPVFLLLRKSNDSSNPTSEATIVSSHLDSFNSRRIKESLFAALIPRVRSEVLDKAHSADTLTYSFEGVDVAGKFVSEQTANLASKAGQRVLNDVTTFNRQNETVVGMHKREGFLRIASDGQVLEVKQVDTFLMSGDAALAAPNPSADVHLPSVGSSEYISSLSVLAAGEDSPSTTAPAVESEEELNAFVTEKLTENQFRRAFRSALDSAELQARVEEVVSKVNADATLEHAEEMLASGSFSMDVLSSLIFEKTVERLHAKVFSLYADGQVSELEMQKYLAALGAASVHCDSADRELLKTFSKSSLPRVIRLQAVVALLQTDAAARTQTQNDAIFATLKEISDKGAADAMSSEALLLMGSILSHDPSSLRTRRQLIEWHNELGLTDPDDVSAAVRTTALLGALANTGVASAVGAAVRFAESKIPFVRSAAVEALQQQTKTVASSHELGATVEEIGSDDIFASQNEDDSELSFLKLPDGLQSKDLISVTKQFPLTSSPGSHFQTSAKASLAVEYSRGRAGLNGWAALYGHFNGQLTELIEVGFISSSVPAAAQKYGVQAEMDSYVKIAGKKVTTSHTAFDNSELQVGGKCPTDSTAAPGSEIQQLFKSYARRHSLVYLGATVLNAKIHVQGSLTSQLLYSAALNCRSPVSRNDLATVSGIVPSADVSVSTVASISVIDSSSASLTTVLRAKSAVPSYGSISPVSSCAKIAAHTSQLMAQSQITSFGGHKKTLMNWRGQQSVEPLSAPKCLVLTIGDFMLGRKPASSANEQFTNDVELGEFEVEDGMIQNAEQTAADQVAESTRQVVQSEQQNADAVRAEASRARGVATSVMERARDVLRNEGSAVRNTVRQDENAIQGAVSAASGSTEGQVSASGQRFRATARDSATQMQNNVAQGASSEEAQIRRDNTRLERAEARDAAEERSALSGFQSQLKQMEQVQADGDTKDLIRRQDKQTLQEDKEIEKMIVAKEERGRERRMEEADKEQTDSIKGVVEREDERNAEKRGFDRLEQQQRRDSQNEMEQSKMQREKDKIRRLEGGDGEARRDADAIQKEMRQNEDSNALQRKLGRAEKRIGDDVNNQNEVQKEIQDTAGKFDQLAKDDRREERKEANELNKMVEGDKRMQAIDSEQQKVRDSVRQAEAQQENAQEMNAIKKEAQSGFQKSAKQARNNEKKIESGVQGEAKAEAKAQEFDKVENQVDKDASAARAEVREASQETEGIVQKGEQANSERQQIAGMQDQLQRSAQQQENGFTKANEENSAINQEAQNSAQKEFRKESKADQAAPREVAEAGAAAENAVQKDNQRDANKRSRFDMDVEKFNAREQDANSGEAKAVEKSLDAAEKQVDGRMDRSSERSKEAQDGAEKQDSKAMGKLQQGINKAQAAANTANVKEGEREASQQAKKDASKLTPQQKKDLKDKKDPAKMEAALRKEIPKPSNDVNKDQAVNMQPDGEGDASKPDGSDPFQDEEADERIQRQQERFQEMEQNLGRDVQLPSNVVSNLEESVEYSEPLTEEEADRYYNGEFPEETADLETNEIPDEPTDLHVEEEAVSDVQLSAEDEDDGDIASHIYDSVIPDDEIEQYTHHEEEQPRDFITEIESQVEYSLPLSE